MKLRSPDCQFKFEEGDCWCAMCDAWNRMHEGDAGDSGKVSEGGPGKTVATPLDDPGPRSPRDGHANPYADHGGSWSEGILERSWEAERDEEERQRER